MPDIIIGKRFFLFCLIQRIGILHGADLHPRSLTRLNAGNDIFKDQACLRICPQLP